MLRIMLWELLIQIRVYWEETVLSLHFQLFWVLSMDPIGVGRDSMESVSAVNVL